MSVDFSGAAGSRMVTSPNVTLGALISAGAWIRPYSQGGANAGIVWNHGTTAPGRSSLRWNGTASSNKLRYQCDRTTDGVWDMTNGLPDLTRWLWVGVTYDGGATGNHPILYLLDQGVWSVLTNGAGLTRTTAPAGALVADGGPMRWGNNATGTTNQYGGYTGHFFVYSRILADAEMYRVATSGARRRPRGAVLSWPGVRLIPTNVIADETGGANPGTGSGTGFAVTEDGPPVRW